MQIILLSRQVLFPTLFWIESVVSALERPRTCYVFSILLFDILTCQLCFLVLLVFYCLHIWCQMKPDLTIVTGNNHFPKRLICLCVYV